MTSGTCAWRVFVYNLTSPLDDNHAMAKVTHKIYHAAPTNERQSLVQAFGNHLGGALYESHAHALTPILEHRLRFSRCRTYDPSQADLIYAPLLPMPRLNIGNTEYPRVCAHNANLTEVSRQLTHLSSPAAACRHFFSQPHHYHLWNCTGWFAEPTGLFVHAMRIGYLHALDSYYPADGYKALHRYPKLMPSVPYPSCVHWSSELERDASLERGNISASAWNATNYFRVTRRDVLAGRQPPRRPLLMLFVGGSWHGDTSVRKRVEAQCKALYPLCEFRPFNGCPSAMHHKQRATFCLEPHGDSPDRKSVSDDVSAGCIPVFFSNASYALTPWFWAVGDGGKGTGAGGDDDQESRLLIDRDAFLKGSVTLRSALASIPAAAIERMQRRLARIALGFQYSTDAQHGDAVDLIMRNLKIQADACVAAGSSAP